MEPSNAKGRMVRAAGMVVEGERWDRWECEDAGGLGGCVEVLVLGMEMGLGWRRGMEGGVKVKFKCLLNSGESVPERRQVGVLGIGIGSRGGDGGGGRGSIWNCINGGWARSD